MEGFFALIVIFFGWVIFRMVISAGARTVGAATKTALGKGSFSENMDVAFGRIGALEARLVNTRIDPNDNESPKITAIEVKGILPVFRQTPVSFIASIVDVTEDIAPVLCPLEIFQEPKTIAFQNVTDIGSASPDSGFVAWSRVGGFIPDLLEPPYSGHREFLVVLRLVNSDKVPTISLGLTENRNDPGVLWETTLSYEKTFEEAGYLEAADKRDKARALCIKIGMAVAMADGNLDDSEGNVLKEWINRALSPFEGDKYNEMRDLYNDAMREAYLLAQKGDLILGDLTAELDEAADTTIRYETIELCFDVMAADGVIAAEEMRVIRSVSEALELDMDEVEKMRDQKIVGLNNSMAEFTSIEELLGLDPGWDEDQIKRHLRGEFQKWNNRLNTLPEGDERQNAQKMLDMIAEARKKYA